MADNIVHNHTPKSETEKQGLLAKLHITDSNPKLSDEEEKTKDKTTKEKVEEKFEEEKVKMNVRIIQGTETALNLKQKAAEQIGGGNNDNAAEVPPPQLAAAANAETDHKEKNGILEMIKEKLPGYPSKSQEEITKEKECDKK